MTPEEQFKKLAEKSEIAHVWQMFHLLGTCSIEEALVNCCRVFWEENQYLKSKKITHETKKNSRKTKSYGVYYDRQCNNPS